MPARATCRPWQSAVTCMVELSRLILEGCSTIRNWGIKVRIPQSNHMRDILTRRMLPGRLSTPERIAEDQHSPDWLTVPYKHNRGILHDGNFPHQSTPITHIKEGLKRVIL